MNKVDRFRRLLKLRTIFKQINQLSWNITSLEKRYPFKTINDVEVESLLESYLEYAREVKKLNDKLKEEVNEGQSTT